MSYYRIRTVFAPAAVFAACAAPYGVKMFCGGIDQCGIGGQNTGLEIPHPRTFHPNACPCQVCRADIHFLEIKYHQFEMDSRTQRSLKAADESRISVKILQEYRPRLFGMHKPHLLPPLYQGRQLPRNGTVPFPDATCKSLISAVAIQSVLFTLDTFDNTLS